MELPRIGKSGGGMFDGIKNKLGLGDSQDSYDEYYDDYGDDYDEGYGDGYEDDSYSERRSSSRSSSRTGAHASGSPNLISMDDVRASTQVPDSLNRDPLPPRQTSTSYSAGSTYRSSFSGNRQVERAADYLRSTETSDLPSTAPRSEGLNSLFTSTAAGAATLSSKPSSYDPYEAYSGSGSATHNPTRSLSVLKPSNYGEVERVAKIVKAGDVVVLSLRNTPDNLAKRILDFSFGVSSALDASVECIADKVFVIVRGSSLTPDELTNLRNQGVL